MLVHIYVQQEALFQLACEAMTQHTDTRSTRTGNELHSTGSKGWPDERRSGRTVTARNTFHSHPLSRL
jgi:hypothetical protein